MSHTNGAGWKPLIISPNPELAEEAGRIWDPEASPARLDRYPDWETVRKAVDNGVNLCLLDVGSEPGAAFPLMEKVRQKGLPIIALHTKNDSDLILCSLRGGAAEFLARPFARDQFNHALERIAHRWAPEAGDAALHNRVYGVMAGKGACGTTTIAVSLAFEMKRTRSERVLLADLDPLTGAISFLLKLKSNYNFLHALANAGRMDDDLWRGLIVSSRGVDILLSSEAPMDLANEADELPPLIHYWRTRYDTVIMDVPSPNRSWGASLARCCDELLLVTTNELLALHSTQNAVSHLRRARVEDAKIRLIVNRYNPAIGLKEAAIEEALGRRIFHLVPNDYETVQKAIVQGKPLPAGTRVGRSIGALADKLRGRQTEKAGSSLLPQLRSLLRGSPEKSRANTEA